MPPDGHVSRCSPHFNGQTISKRAFFLMTGERPSSDRSGLSKHRHVVFGSCILHNVIHQYLADAGEVWFVCSFFDVLIFST